jgi:hypothetical protein
MFAVVIALVIFFLVMAGPGITSPSPSPSASPPPAPAGAELVARALKSRKAATKAHAALSRVRRCFGDSAPVRVGAAPERDATAQEWGKARAHWRHQAKDWKAKTRDGLHAMRNPGGHPNGERWIPAARWLGWPESQLGTLVYIMAKRGGTGESGGCPGAFNDVIDCTGLMQMWPGNLKELPLPKWVRDLSWSAKIRWLKDGMNNLWASLLLWRECGWSPWAR